MWKYSLNLIHWITVGQKSTVHKVKSLNFWCFIEAMRCIVMVVEQYVQRLSPAYHHMRFFIRISRNPNSQVTEWDLHRLWRALWLQRKLAWIILDLKKSSLRKKNHCSFTRRAILILRVQLGPEFLRGNLWFNVISSASSRRVRGSVNVPSEQSCFSSFTWNIKCDEVLF